MRKEHVNIYYILEIKQIEKGLVTIFTALFSGLKIVFYYNKNMRLNLNLPNTLRYYFTF